MIPMAKKEEISELGLDEARCALLWRKLLAAAAKNDPVAVELMGELGRATVCIPRHTEQTKFGIADSSGGPYRSDPIMLGSHWSMFFEIEDRFYGDGDDGDEPITAQCNAKSVLEFLADQDASSLIEWCEIPASASAGGGIGYNYGPYDFIDYCSLVFRDARGREHYFEPCPEDDAAIQALLSNMDRARRRSKIKPTRLSQTGKELVVPLLSRPPVWTPFGDGESYSPLADSRVNDAEDEPDREWPGSVFDTLNGIRIRVKGDIYVPEPPRRIWSKYPLDVMSIITIPEDNELTYEWDLSCEKPKRDIASLFRLALLAQHPRLAHHLDVFYRESPLPEGETDQALPGPLFHPCESNPDAEFAFEGLDHEGESSMYGNVFDDFRGEEKCQGIKDEFILIPVGQVDMGRPAKGGKDVDEGKPRHQVGITTAFELGKYPVSQAEWRAVMGYNPSPSPAANRPVVNVSRDDVYAFLARMNERNDGYRYRLPTPAEWRHAAPARKATSGHSESVQAVALTPDGRRAVSASKDNTLKVWDLESGVELHTLAGHASCVVAVAVTPDGRKAVSASWDRTLRVWDLGSGVGLHTLVGHSATISAVAVTPDGRRGISISEDGTLRTWDLESGEALSTFKRVHKARNATVNALAVTPDGRRVVAASDDATLKVLDLESGAKLTTLTGHEAAVVAVVVKPDGRHAVSVSNDDTVKVWDVKSGKEVNTWEGVDFFEVAAVTPDGRRVVSASVDHKLKVWDLKSKSKSKHKICTATGHADWVQAIAVTPDGRRAVSASDDKTLKVWDLEAGDELHTLARRDEPNVWGLHGVMGDIAEWTAGSDDGMLTGRRSERHDHVGFRLLREAVVEAQDDADA
jgi:WD40 repeat protein